MAFKSVGIILLVALLLVAGCAPAPTPTPLPTNTPPPTRVPPTATPVPETGSGSASPALVEAVQAGKPSGARTFELAYEPGETEGQGTLVVTYFMEDFWTLIGAVKDAAATFITAAPKLFAAETDLAILECRYQAPVLDDDRNEVQVTLLTIRITREQADGAVWSDVRACGLQDIVESIVLDAVVQDEWNKMCGQ